MYIDNFKITKDGETVAVYFVGTNQKTGEETLKPVAYTRDFLGGLEAVARKMSVAATEQKELKDAIEVIKSQHEEIKKLVKKGCRECLSE